MARTDASRSMHSMAQVTIIQIWLSKKGDGQENTCFSAQLADAILSLTITQAQTLISAIQHHISKMDKSPALEGDQWN